MTDKVVSADMYGVVPGRFTGSRIGDISGLEKTTGTAKYPGDLKLEGMLDVGVIRSPYPHADILSIELADALSVPGIVAAVTSEDFGQAKYVGFGGALSDRPPMACGVVRYVGEEVAALAATSAAALAQAIPLVRVRYRRKPAILDCKTARNLGAPRLHNTVEGRNIVRRSTLKRGNPAEQHDLDEHIFAAHYESGSQTHTCLEPHTAIAFWPQEDGPLDVWMPTQGPMAVRLELAHIFGIDEQRIRMHDVAIGGDFGAHAKISTSEAIAVALARKTRRPVRIRLSREDEFSVTKHRIPFDVDIELRAHSNGRLTHMNAEVLSDMGAYHFVGAGDFGFFPQSLSSLYAIENLSISSVGVYSNTNPPGSFRGAGAPQATFIRESALDELAKQLGIDPIEIRMRNLNQPQDPKIGWKLDNGSLKACLQRACQEIGWRSSYDRCGKRHGFGVAIAAHVTGVGELKAGAFVDVDDRGGITVRSSSADPGTGQRTALAQVAAHELGVAVSSVDVVLAELHSSPSDPGLSASKGSYISTNAVGAAARDVAAKLRSAAVVRFGVNEVTLSNGEAQTSMGSLSFADLVAHSTESVAGVLRGTGEFRGGRALDDPDASDGYSYVAQAAEVEVDEALGLVRVLRFVSVHDSGTILNPITARGQVEGGIIMGIGAALGEEVVSEEGRIANTGFADYAVPRASEHPEMKVIFLDSPEGPGRYGSRGIAEVCLAPTSAVIANAVAHATGVRVRSLPITPDKIVEAKFPTLDRRLIKPIWMRPNRWWIELVRRLYPLGLHDVLHRWATRQSRLTPRRAGAVSLRQPNNVHDVLQIMASAPRTRAFGGGTDLMLARKQGLSSNSATWVNVRSSGRLADIELDAKGLRLGGAITLAELAASAVIPRGCALRDTALEIASHQIRNVATLAGNLCQAKRCSFYRHDFNCYKRVGGAAPCYAIEGDHRYYHAVMGGRRCQAITPSDMATTLTALDAVLILGSVVGERHVNVTKFYVGPGEPDLREGEVLTEISVPRSSLQRSTAFEKMSLWNGGFALCSSAASLSLDRDGRIIEVRVAVGGIAPTPLRLTAVEEALIGRLPTPDGIDAVSGVWIREAHPLKNNDWKLTAGKTLVARSINAALAEARSRAKT